MYFSLVESVLTYVSPLLYTYFVYASSSVIIYVSVTLCIHLRLCISYYLSISLYIYLLFFPCVNRFSLLFFFSLRNPSSDWTVGQGKRERERERWVMPPMGSMQGMQTTRKVGVYLATFLFLFVFWWVFFFLLLFIRPSVKLTCLLCHKQKKPVNPTPKLILATQPFHSSL